MTRLPRALPVLALAVACAPSTPSDSADPREGATEPTEPTEPLRQTTEPTVDPGDPALLGDCAPNDPAIGPEVVDLDGDGVDSDCDGQDGPSARPAIVLRGPDGEWNLGQGLVARVDLSGDGVADIMGCSSERCTIWGDGLHVVDEVVGVASFPTATADEVCASQPDDAAPYEPRVRCWSSAGTEVLASTDEPYFVNELHVHPDGASLIAHEARDDPQGPRNRQVWWDRGTDTRQVIWTSDVEDHLRRVRGIASFRGVPSVLLWVGEGDPVVSHSFLCPAPFGGDTSSCTELAALDVTGVGDADGDGLDELWLFDPLGDYAVADPAVDSSRAAAVAWVDAAVGQARSVPDLTGDGVDDVLVVARSTPTTPGRVHLVPGPVSGEVSLAGSPSWAGVALGGGFGAFTDVGDVDGDGLLDLVIAAPDDGYGAIFVVPGTELQRP